MPIFHPRINMYVRIVLNPALF